MYGNQFFGIKARASNIVFGHGDYSIEMLKQDFPQFFSENGESIIPLHILEMFIDRCNNAIQPEKWLDAWRYAAGLYIAHYATLYMRTYAPHSENIEQATATGALTGVVKSETLGDASVSYDTTAVTKATENWGGFNSTQYGQMLATEARLIGLGGSYVI